MKPGEKLERVRSSKLRIEFSTVENNPFIMTKTLTTAKYGMSPFIPSLALFVNNANSVY